MPLLGEAELPHGLRVYAIGDIHGCLDRLHALHALIEDDLQSRPATGHMIVYCGDYVDRGPDSAGVLDLMADRCSGDERMVCLYGNHEEELEGFLDDPLRWARHWLRYGGGETIRSYGIDVDGHDMSDDGIRRLHAEFAAAFPAHHRQFLSARPRIVGIGDFTFVHAGIRPGVALEHQDSQDLIWIREPFLSDFRDHGTVVVHGHTPVPAPDVRCNRINIDTGAVFGGDLTCAAIEGSDVRFLSV